MNQFLGMKMKGLYVVLLFIPLFAVPSICDAANACIAGTPIFNVIAPNPKTPGATVSYSVKAIGSGFATFELRASDVGILQSGTFSSGQTVSGNYNTPSGAGLITFNIKDSSGNVIPNCFAKADVTSAQDECKENLKHEICYYNGPSDFHVWDLYVLNIRVPQHWGTPVSYSDCFKCAPPIAHNFQVNSSNLGLVNSGSIFSNQMVVGSYSIPYGTNKESYALTFPGSDWLTGQFYSWATTAPPCNSSFSLWGTLAVGSNIQFNANAAKINGSRPDNYNWKVDEKPYEQGSNKNIVYGSFSAGPHTILLTVDDGLGTSCSRGGTITIPAPPPPPPLPCTVDFDAKSGGVSCLSGGCKYGDPISFTANVKSGGPITSYDWTMTKTTGGSESFDGGHTDISALKTFVPADGGSHKVHLTAKNSANKTCTMDKTINLSIVLPPLPCTVDFDVRNSTKSCLTSSCNYNEPITFVVSAATGPITGYTWTMTKTTGGPESFDGGHIGTPVSKTFVPADGKSYKVHLAAIGNTCTMDKTINIKPSMPGWNEIAPYLMQLGPIGLLALLFLARMIFLRL